MKMVKLRYRKGFTVVSGNGNSQAATMVLPPGAKEGGPENNHRGADQWLFIVSGKGVAIIAGKEVALGPLSLALIQRGQNHAMSGRRTS
jgi:mannose-6-phosphate isomerase-like protein (cupin superfamily)